MKAPVSIVAVGEPATLDKILEDRRVQYYLGALKHRRPSERMLIIKRADSSSNTERLLQMIEPLFQYAHFATAQLIADVPVELKLSEIEDLENLRSDKDVAEELEQKLDMKPDYFRDVFKNYELNRGNYSEAEPVRSVV